MHRFAAWGLTALAAGSMAAIAADPKVDKPWYSRVLGSDKPADGKTFADVPARPPLVVGPLDPTALANALKAEQDAYLRRLDVCLKLRQIAAKSNDDGMLAQADDLEKQATALYHQRAARLGVKANLRAPGDAVTAMTADAPPVPTRTAPRQFREVQP